MTRRMLQSAPIPSSEITSAGDYINRRKFLKLGCLLGVSGLIAACSPQVETLVPTANPSATRAATPTPLATSSPVPNEGPVDELGDGLTSYDEITSFVNYYEFTTNKRGVTELAQNYRTSPWEIEVSGLVQNPKTYGLEDLLKRFTVEERIYRMRCVETWSMVIPWMGFPLAQLLREVEPLASARYVRFETYTDPETMPGLEQDYFPWPYTEGLRLDEAMHDLTILATGLYGKDLLVQNGAPIRLVVPWKYGFKSLKSIHKIELVEEIPATFWSSFSAEEYGFYANVNPQKPHPRWSQSREVRVGETQHRPTLLFNGYAEEVAHLYAGMDLQINY